MMNKSLESFILFLAEDREGQEKVKALQGDMDALAAYARELGYDVFAQELREYRKVTIGRLEDRVKKARQEQSGPGAQALLALIELGETDSEVAKRLEELGDATREEFIAYGREKGFVFNEQDLDEVGKNILQPTDELSDEELEMVAGGTSGIVIGVLVFLGLLGVIAAAFIVGFISVK